MKISIVGLGWYGTPLALELLKAGHEVTGTTQGEEKKLELEALGIKVSILSSPSLPDKEVLNADIIVFNIPPFENQLQWLKEWSWNRKTWVILISSTSVISSPNTIGAKTLKEEEAWLQSSFSDWTIVRFGGLLGGERHPGKYLSGKENLPARLWPVNLIHQKDAVGVTKAIIEKKVKNRVLNAVSNQHPTREELYSEYCRKHGLPLPTFDQNDSTVGPKISHEEIETIYKNWQPLL